MSIQSVMAAVCLLLSIVTDQVDSVQNAVRDAAQNTVILSVYSDKNETYVLKGEQAQAISNLFYDHEMQIIDSPLESIATLQFRIGEDLLCTSMGDLGTLDGRINGNLVVLELSGEEYEAVYQIVSPYAEGIP